MNRRYFRDRHHGTRGPMKWKAVGMLYILVLCPMIVLGCNGSGREAEPLSQPVGIGLEEEDFHRIVSGGVDDRLNSYPWAMEQFDGDRDGTPEVYLGTLRDALCHQLLPGVGPQPPERWQCPNEFWDPHVWEAYVEACTGPAYVYQGRYDGRTGSWTWLRVWEPDFDTEVFGFRGARVFKGALYMLSNHESRPCVWKTTDGIHYERASPPGMGAVEGGLYPPGFRGAQVFGGKLCIASDREAAIYCSSDPSVEPGSWEQVNSTGFLASGGRVHEQAYSQGEVTSATAGTLTDDDAIWYPMVNAGRFLRIESGTGSGQSVRILSNTQTTLTIEGAWSILPDSTSTYRVYNPQEPDSGRIWQIAPFNGYLYAIAFNTGGSGAALWKSADPAPGNWTRVIDGGFGNPSAGFLALRPFRDHLYIGSGTYAAVFLQGEELQACEILRVDAEDNVELVVGKDRPAGVAGADPVEPISGLSRGFGRILNLYIWYMGEHDGWFYVGTGDSSGLLWDVLEESGGWSPGPWWGDDGILGPTGCDMWRTRDGIEWFKVTDTGFGEHDNSGIRNLLSTRWGLLVGMANAVDGLELWLGKRE